MSCIHEDMLINAGSETIAIDDLNIGDMVSGWNPITGEVELTEVMNIIISDSSTNYKVNDFIISEDQPLLDLGMNVYSISPSTTLTNYDYTPGQLIVGYAMFGPDGTHEIINSIVAHVGTHRNYTICTKLTNFFADNKLVASTTQMAQSIMSNIIRIGDIPIGE